MLDFRLLSAAEQVAARLREEILRGGLSGTAPGVHKMAEDFGIHRTTAEEALRLLEKEGLLLPQGPGRRRLIKLPETFAPPALRVAILPYERTDRNRHYILDLQYRLIEAGHAASFTRKTLLDLDLDAKRVERLVNDTGAEAWVVLAGPRAVLEWFADQPVPAFALFGRRRTVRIAGIGPDKLPALLGAARRLIALGHRRIVMLLREEQRKPQPGLFARAFLGELSLHGLSASNYNLPDWEDSPEGFRNCLDSLFRVTPPTALIIDESFLFNVAQQHLARRGILAPGDVSLVCTDPDPSFAWFHPTIAHIHWSPDQAVRRIVRWAANVSRGVDDRRQSDTKAEFVEGGTIGPARTGGDKF